MQFYRINPKVEYSTDFNFFLEHQIGVSRSQEGVSFFSRLVSKIFRYFTDRTKWERMDNPKEIKSICHTIHCEILRGEHGKGQLIN